MQLLSKYNKGIRFLLCVIDICNAYFKKCLRDNDIVMYSTHNEGKSVVAERFIRTLKGKIYKYMT